MFKYSANGKRHDLWHQWNKVQMEKALWHQWNTPLIHSPNEKGMVLRKILYQSVMIKYKNAMIKK